MAHCRMPGIQTLLWRTSKDGECKSCTMYAALPMSLPFTISLHTAQANRLRLEDHAVIGGVLGGVLTTAIFLKRASVVNCESPSCLARNCDADA